MVLGLLLAVSSIAPAVENGPFLGTSFQPQGTGGSLLASMDNYPSGRADDVRRPGFNGRLWIGESIIGGRAAQYPLAWGSPGPTAYGASDRDFSAAWARIGTQAIPVSPWISIPREGLYRLEAARNEWLKREGYVGGVRTFVNDLYVNAPVGRASIEPRGSFQVPVDMPSFRSRQQVMDIRPGDRVSLPPTAPRAMAARVANMTAPRVASR